MNYSACMFPKVNTKKKAKPCNGWKHKAERVCAYCGTPGADRHEVFGASNRIRSIELGYQVDVCHKHHEELHNNSTEWAKAENRRLKRKFEAKYIKDQVAEGTAARSALANWMLEFGKNYIEEIMP